MQSRHILPTLLPILALLATGCVEEPPEPNPLTDESTPADEYEFRAILDLPGLEVHPPIRVEDLTRHQLMRVSSAPGGWHDFRIIDWMGSSWSFFNRGYTPVGDPAIDEPNDAGWGLPIYASISGEVIDCWRGLQHEDGAWSGNSTNSGNYVFIKGDDGVTFLAAHLLPGSIPTWICPNEPEPTLADGSSNTLGWISDLVTTYPGSNILAETYVEPAERVQIDAGEYIGKMGAHGSAGNTHTHVTLGRAQTVAGVDSHLQNPQTGGVAWFHVGFEHAFMRISAAGVQPTDPWTATSGRDIAEASEFDSLAVWPHPKQRETFSGSYRLGDYDLDGRDDLLCTSAATGWSWTDFASPTGDYGGTDASSNYDFCSGDEERLFTADMNGDGRQDMVCHDYDSGDTWWDLADAAGQFGATEGWSTNPFCNNDSQDLHLGDFDGDGLTDLLCHNIHTGARYIDRAANGFLGTDESRVTPWCDGRWQRLHVGRLGMDAADDMLCHDTQSGVISIDRTGGVGNLLGPTDEERSPWCQNGGHQLFLADLNGGGIDELVCFDRDTGEFWVDAPTLVNGSLYGTTDWSSPVETEFCTGPYDTLRFGDVDGDGSEDAVCFSHATGQRWIDYSDASPRFPFTGFLQGTDETAGTWCQFSTQGLH